MPFIKNKLFMPNQPNTSDTFFSNRLNLTLATLFVLGMTSLLAVIAFVLCKIQLPAVNEISQLGQLGDFLGGTLNPIFGFLGFSGILITLYAQKKNYH